MKPRTSQTQCILHDNFADAQSICGDTARNGEAQQKSKFGEKKRGFLIFQRIGAPTELKYSLGAY